MEVILNNLWLFCLFLLAGILLGFIFGKLSVRKTYNGTIYLEPSDKPDCERVRFVLNIELDELGKIPEVNFKVVKSTDVIWE